MGAIVDAAYLIGLLASSPVLVPRLLWRGKHRIDWAARLGRGEALPEAAIPRVLIHGVSVGEVNAIRQLVDSLLAASPSLEVVVASTTATGLARAHALYSDRCCVVQYPLDLSASVRGFLDRIQPDLFASVELEVWPNFTSACSKRGITQIVVNGRLSERSFRGYRRVRPLVRPMFKRIDQVGVQDEVYADRFRRLGADPLSIVVTGTMKWDTARIEDDVPGSSDLAKSMGIDRSRPLIVAGSTAPDEHLLLHQATPEGVQLLCAPRRPEWFDQAASVLTGCARRSRSDSGSATDRFLLDTMGELRAAYSLADVAVVGRSFGDFHGSDMMEPAALGKPVVVGPATGDFQQTVEALDAAGGILVSNRESLSKDLESLINRGDVRRNMSERARAVVVSHQGATKRTVEMITRALEKRKNR